MRHSVCCAPLNSDSRLKSVALLNTYSKSILASDSLLLTSQVPTSPLAGLMKIVRDRGGRKGKRLNTPRLH